MDKSEKKTPILHVLLLSCTPSWDRFENITVKHEWEVEGAVSLHLHIRNLHALYRLKHNINEISEGHGIFQESENVCSFTYLMSQFTKKAENSESSENNPDQFQQHFACSYFSSIFDRNFETEHQLSCLSQMSMIVIFVPSMNKCLFGKRLAETCSVLVDDVPYGVLRIFSLIFHIS